MTPIKFDEIVETRAQERVDSRVREFKNAVWKAFCTLCGYNPRMYDSYRDVGRSRFQNEDLREVLTILLSDDTKKGWPKKFWDEERSSISTAILASLDDLQRAMLAEKSNNPEMPKE